VSEAAQLVTAVATLLVAAGGLIASVGAVVVALRNTRKITEIHAATNGLVAKLGDAREAKGRAEGAQEERSR
jgi:hypothetical protein